MNASPNTREHIQEHPHAAALIKANKELIKGFSSATLKLRFDFVHKETKQQEWFFGTGISIAPNIVLTVRHYLFHPDTDKRRDYEVQGMMARVDALNGTVAMLRVCRTHPELYKDPPLWFGSNVNWMDINNMPSDIDPMSSFHGSPAEHWMWRDFVFLEIISPVDLLLPPPYFLPETDVFTGEPIIVGGFVIGEKDNDRLLSKYENYTKVYQKVNMFRSIPFFVPGSLETWSDFISALFNHYPKRNIVVSLGMTHEHSSQRLGLYNASTEVGMAGSAVSPIVEAVEHPDSDILPLWGIHAGRFTDGLLNAFLSVEHPLFIVQYTFTVLNRFLSQPRFDLSEYVNFKKQVWDYISCFDWLDTYCGNLRRDVHSALINSQFEELSALSPPKNQTAVTLRKEEKVEEKTPLKRKINSPLNKEKPQPLSARKKNRQVQQR